MIRSARVLLVLMFYEVLHLADSAPKITYVAHVAKGTSQELEYVTHIGPATGSLNWKQCAWKSLESDKDLGLIKECSFVKKSSSTALRVTYDGDYRLRGCTACCNRWYFTFDNKECTNPIPIDAVEILSSNPKNINMHQHRNIEGICEGLKAGIIKIGFWVGKCTRHSHGPGDTYTGHVSSSRFIIEELPKPQD